MTTKQPKVTRRKITEYLPDNHNANLGSERGLQMLEDSLHKVGAGRSLVVDANDKIPAGNKTLEAAVNAGYTDVIEIETDGKALIVHKRTDWDLDDPKGAARQYAYLDNRVSEVSLTWDANVIAADVEAGSIPKEAFYDWELDKILGNMQEIDRDAMWQGMPEFDSEDQLGLVTIKVHFNTEEDVKAFAELIGQKLTMQTKYVWYPKAEKLDAKSFRVTDES